MSPTQHHQVVCPEHIAVVALVPTTACRISAAAASPPSDDMVTIPPPMVLPLQGAHSRVGTAVHAQPVAGLREIREHGFTGVRRGECYEQGGAEADGPGAVQDKDQHHTQQGAPKRIAHPLGHLACPMLVLLRKRKRRRDHASTGRGAGRVVQQGEDRAVKGGAHR